MNPNHHGAGLGYLFQHYRHKECSLVAEFQQELIFRGFLIAFGKHVRKTIESDSKSHPVSHWWTGPNGKFDSLFVDPSQGHSRQVFDEKGQKRLAQALAEDTFSSLELYFTAGCYKPFLESEKCNVSYSVLGEYLENVPKYIKDEPLPQNLGYKGTFVIDPVVKEAERRSKMSKTKLAKRGPDTEKALTGTERKKLFDAKRKNNPETEDEAKARKDKERLKKQKQRLKQNGDKFDDASTTADLQ